MAAILYNDKQCIDRTKALKARFEYVDEETKEEKRKDMLDHVEMMKKEINERVPDSLKEFLDDVEGWEPTEQMI